MTTYIIENTKTEETGTRATWNSAFRAAKKMGDPDSIRIIERDRDGEREYNIKGEILGRDGHYAK